jgi:hypothetical protein
LLLSAGGLAAARHGPAVVQRATDAAKVALTRYELAQLAKAYQLERAVGSQPPRPENQSGFLVWASETLHASGRDTSRDLWQQPWRFDRDGRNVVFRSAGPNLSWDHCADGAPQAEVSTDDTGDAEAPARDDDLCDVVAPE